MGNENLIRPPFTSTRLEEERELDTDIVFTVRLNERYQEILKDGKLWFDTDKNGTVLKNLAEIGHKVLLNTFSRDMLERLFKKERVRR